MTKTTPIEIHYRDLEVKKMYIENGGIKTDGSTGFDLLLEKDVRLLGTSALLPPTWRPLRFMAEFGVVVRVPRDTTLLLMPRSSTFNRYNLMQGNSLGLIDNDYCGEGDFLKTTCIWFPHIGEVGEQDGFREMHNPENLTIPKGTAMFQLFCVKKCMIELIGDFTPDNKSRGGFGSTGV